MRWLSKLKPVDFIRCENISTHFDRNGMARISFTMRNTGPYVLHLLNLNASAEVLNRALPIVTRDACCEIPPSGEQRLSFEARGGDWAKEAEWNAGKETMAKFLVLAGNVLLLVHDTRVKL